MPQEAAATSCIYCRTTDLPDPLLAPRVNNCPLARSRRNLRYTYISTIADLKGACSGPLTRNGTYGKKEQVLRNDTSRHSRGRESERDTFRNTNRQQRANSQLLQQPTHCTHDTHHAMCHTRRAHSPHSPRTRHATTVQPVEALLAPDKTGGEDRLGSARRSASGLWALAMPLALFLSVPFR